MPITLQLDHPDFPDDMEFGISELGRVKNHGTLEVDDDTVAMFEASRGMSIADAFANNAIVSVVGTQQNQQNQNDGQDGQDAQIVLPPEQQLAQPGDGEQ